MLVGWMVVHMHIKKKSYLSGYFAIQGVIVSCVNTDVQDKVFICLILHS